MDVAPEQEALGVEQVEVEMEAELGEGGVQAVVEVEAVVEAVVEVEVEALEQDSEPNYPQIPVVHPTQYHQRE
jgi:hypothetical protein